MNEDIKRLVEASLRVANELDRQAQMQRAAAARMLALASLTTKETDHG